MSDTITCPSWCTGQTVDCREHWSDPGSALWPGVRATAYPHDGTPDIVAHPTWGEVDGLQPAVALYLDGGDDIDHTIDMTPDEAIALAANLVRAAEAVRAG